MQKTTSGEGKSWIRNGVNFQCILKKSDGRDCDLVSTTLRRLTKHRLRQHPRKEKLRNGEGMLWIGVGDKFKCILKNQMELIAMRFVQTFVNWSCTASRTIQSQRKWDRKENGRIVNLKFIAKDNGKPALETMSPFEIVIGQVPIASTLPFTQSQYLGAINENFL